MPETVLCTATKDPKMCCRMNLCLSHVFLKQVMCFPGLYQSGMPQKRPREQLGISLGGSEIQKLYRMMSITRDVKHQQQTKYDTI